MQPSFSIPSYAKINWMLRIIGKREDKFHELFTLFQTVSLCDTIRFEDSDELKLECDNPDIPTDDRNLIIRAAVALSALEDIKPRARIALTKRIPSPGGLGGGSSNAAIALIGLRKLWKLGHVSDETLWQIAASIGSDVPFFLFGGTAAGTGRGENIEPIPDATIEYIIIVTPPIGVSTAEAFSSLNAATLTRGDRERILTVCRKQTESADFPFSGLKNDFEESVFDIYPEIKRVKDTLINLGAAAALLCGSGGSVFAVFDNNETRQATMKALDREVTWRKFAVATISRSQYREAVFGQVVSESF